MASTFVVPQLARVDLEPGLGLRRPAHHVEGVLHVLRGERLAVVPLHVVPQEEDEVAVVVLPRPLLGQLGDDRVHALLLLGGIVVHEVVEAGAGLLHGGDRRLLVGRQARRRAERGGDQHPAVLRGSWAVAADAAGAASSSRTTVNDRSGRSGRGRVIGPPPRTVGRGALCHLDPSGGRRTTKVIASDRCIPPPGRRRESRTRRKDRLRLLQARSIYSIPPRWNGVKRELAAPPRWPAHGRAASR